jgi:hypothetical protein
LAYRLELLFFFFFNFVFNSPFNVCTSNIFFIFFIKLSHFHLIFIVLLNEIIKISYKMPIYNIGKLFSYWPLFFFFVVDFLFYNYIIKLINQAYYIYLN